jgi:hypothetical protein
MGKALWMIPLSILLWGCGGVVEREDTFGEGAATNVGDPANNPGDSQSGAETCPSIGSLPPRAKPYTLGPAPLFPPPLMRGLSGSPEGERCLVPESGSLDSVEVALWNDGITKIEMDVYVSCGTEMVKAVTVSLPGSAFPAYDGIHGEMRSTTFRIIPALDVHEGDIVGVMFRADGASSPNVGAVSGIYDEDVDSTCEFFADDEGTQNNWGGSWDYMAQLHIR